MRGERVVLSLALSAILSGCVCSGHVGVIGAHEQYGQISSAAPPAGEVELFDAPMTYSLAKQPCQSRCDILTYRRNSRREPAKPLGRFSYQQTPAGVVVALPGGPAVFKRGDTEVVRRYRRGYGYPAQLLQLVALPADTVIETVGLIVVYPYRVFEFLASTRTKKGDDR